MKKPEEMNHFLVREDTFALVVILSVTLGFICGVIVTRMFHALV
jgi:hypothetical protein